MIKPKYLYHGSQYKLDVLLPHAASGLPEENGTEYGVYAYDNKDFVLPFTLSIKPYNNGSKSFQVDDNTGITTISAGLLDETATGYIYKVPSDSFERLDERQWLSCMPVTPIEVAIVKAKDYLKKVIFTGSSKIIRQISDSIAYCGLVCKYCHFSDQCDSCRSENNCCGLRKSSDGCYQYNCCANKGISGCWQCDAAPCDKGMFADSHDVRLSAFITYIKSNGKEKLAERLYFNMQNGIYYGHCKDYDGLGSVDAVIRKLEVSL